MAKLSFTKGLSGGELFGDHFMAGLAFTKVQLTGMNGGQKERKPGMESKTRLFFDKPLIS